MSVIETKKLTKEYIQGDSSIIALNSVSLRIEKGEFIAIMGASGSGKSTLLHIIGGLDRASSGQVMFNSKDITSLNEEDLAMIRLKQIGFIFQNYNLLSVLSAEENAALPLIVQNKKASEYQEKVDELFNMLGIYKRRHNKTDQLSGGEQQRVAIARALIAEPTVILADEPTGNLDSITSEEISEVLKRCSETLNQTIVMVTHDSKTAAYTDRIIFLKDGSIEGQEKLGQKLSRDKITENLNEIEV